MSPAKRCTNGLNGSIRFARSPKSRKEVKSDVHEEGEGEAEEIANGSGCNRLDQRSRSISEGGKVVTLLAVKADLLPSVSWCRPRFMIPSSLTVHGNQNRPIHRASGLRFPTRILRVNSRCVHAYRMAFKVHVPWLKDFEEASSDEE